LNERDELLTYLLDAEGIQPQKFQRIAPRESSSQPCLSFAQERFWFLDQLQPDRSIYNSCKAERLSGKLDVAALNASLNTIVRRHEVLRTTYVTIDGNPIPAITPAAKLDLAMLDLRSTPEGDVDREIRRLAANECRRPFNLTNDCPLRVTLLRLSEFDHVLLLVLHQIVFDSWSVGVFFRELWTLYEAHVNGTIADLPMLPLQYADYAIWQRSWLSGDILESQLGYWRRQLHDPLSRTELSTDHLRPAIQSFAGAKLPVSLTESLAKALRQLSRSHATTLFTVLLTAFKILLSRYTGQEDIVVGCPILNRSLPEITNLIGSFVNTLVLRTDLSQNPSCLEAIFRVREVCMGAYAHQDLPFERLVQQLQPTRDLGRNALFQTMFAFQNTPVSRPKFAHLVSKSMDIETGISKFDLTFSLANGDHYISGYVEYNSDLFERRTVERMVIHFQTLLEGIVDNPHQRISELRMLTQSEQRRLVVELNDTATDHPQAKRIHELFEEQVERTPEVIAVKFREQQLTYRELNARANQLAHYVRQQGVSPEKHVAICVERSLEMVVGLLAILKAGGAYVPLDPACPMERLWFMLEELRVSVIVTQENLIHCTQDPTPRPERFHVCLDRDWPIIARQRATNPPLETSAESVAYVIYTSGSTGKPKGVQVSHKSVVNCLQAIGREVRLTENDVLLAVTTLSFDIAALELFLPLWIGATVVLAPREETVDGGELLRRLKESSASIMQATPSTWQLLLEAGWKDARGFKMLCGGESMPRQLAESLLAQGELWNLYGPSETTIWSAIHKVQLGEGPVPIGRPIANTQIHILDSHLQPVPVGVAGELYIGGDGLARGYWNQPDFTAENFIANPFAPGQRLYKTGDRVRYLPDGNIEFLGRVDHQVKIRGCRIELGEIEKNLDQHPKVKQSILVVREGESLVEPDLVAYVVPGESIPSVTDLRNFLASKLPEYMIPSVFVMLEALPFTPSGKVDRNALPPVDGQRPKVDQALVEPRTEVEELVAQVWREVLKLDKIGVCDNFFDLGGHSLLATRVVARLRASFSIDLPLRNLFELPTIAGLAGHIESQCRDQCGVRTQPIPPVTRDRPLPLGFSQRRLWFLSKLDPGLTAYNVPATFRITGALKVGALEEALNEIIKRHEILRTRIVEIDAQPFQEIFSEVLFSLPVVDLSGLSKDEARREIERQATEDARQPYDLGVAPLIRAKLLRVSEKDHVLILNFHHIICDGSSLVVFYRELTILYGGFLRGAAARQLALLPIQYGDYAVWQTDWLCSDEMESQLAYWKQQLGAGFLTLNLPTDYDRQQAQTYRGARQSILLPEELTSGLKDLSRREGVTLFMTLLAAFNILLSRVSGQGDIVIGSTIAGRDRRETEGLIGFFINAIALRIDLSGNPSFIALLKRVREVCLDAYTHQDLPFEKLVEEMNPPRDFSRNPIFNVVFNMVDRSERVLTLAGCKVTNVSHAEPEAKFDIVLHASEVDGRIELAMVYNSDLFGERRIKLLLEQFEHLLLQVTQRPANKIDQCSIVVPAHRSDLPDPSEPLDDTWGGAIHELISKRAGITPEEIAVIDSDDAWTYRELDQRSSQLANYLVANGIRQKDVVVLYAHRSSPMVIALLGVLKAGAAFVILDPAYPPARLIAFLRIAQPTGWIHMSAAGQLLPELETCLNTLDLSCRVNLPSGKDALSECLGQEDEIGEDITRGADAPAYIAFTSGSSGEPKAVLGRHGPITHFLPWQKQAFDLHETDRFCLLSGLAYNHLHRDVFTPLALGAVLYIPPPEISREPERLIEWLRANEISVLHLTPALGELLLTASGQPLPAVRRVFFGGDVLTRREVACIRELVPNATIGCFYGATETQRAVGYYEIPRDFSIPNSDVNRPVPLGQGIKDVQVLLLNKTGQLAGVGELAELYVRSPHLAAGYIGDEVRTTEVFMTNSFTNDPNDRMYRTGDLGRYLPDGNVEWAGRNDRLVNIRGFRIELEEIESVLKQHPVVQDAAVIVQEYETSSAENSKPETPNPKLDRCLVAYVVADEVQQSLIDLLHGYLSSRLPDYMVPAHFVMLEQLPLSPNGKVDYRALPRIEQSLPDSSSAMTSPRNEIEARVSTVFCQVLGREHVGMEENFFRLGGHSLLAAQAAARIREAFGVALDLRTFLEAPTVVALAKQISLRIKATDTTPVTHDPDREEIEL
jgi:amino acid adenylation domain-containing protein